ncbi:PP2C family serine/threonine-protein phosphatase [Opitutus sp. ER46]|uniref:PP2C family protein-serine/threonine phosphatase n=1 Tax=Opitutus sp. ER46 TaxID=2161864 RepID=UPI000D30D14A|nr:PP2C family serine/threonine-protein phosphatase [Opitutus sp. ER46]PTX94252.1 serine/threonine-protein phosphatase [Opitutus sp. ER46]
MPSIRAAALSDIGRVRRENEDRLVCDENALLFGVADGVGGLPGGGEAAELAIGEVQAAFAQLAPGAEPDLATIVRRANTAVGRLGVQLSPAMGIGTTLTVGCIRGAQMRLAHVGDSRCYLAHRGEFRRLTEDHSVENEARLRRARGEVVFYHEINRQALTRCVGQPTLLEIDLINHSLQAGDRFLFCTDGVTRMISDEELADFLQEFDAPDLVLRQIVSQAVTRGGPDNATGVVVFVDQA